jgi:hypothetical protein
VHATQDGARGVARNLLLVMKKRRRRRPGVPKDRTRAEWIRLRVGKVNGGLLNAKGQDTSE